MNHVVETSLEKKYKGHNFGHKVRKKASICSMYSTSTRTKGDFFQKKKEKIVF